MCIRDRVLGAHGRVVNGIAGVLFSVWAPNARRVSVVGDFNDWDGRRHLLRRRGSVWELFIPDVVIGMRYQFEICSHAVSYTHLDVYKRQG